MDVWICAQTSVSHCSHGWGIMLRHFRFLPLLAQWFRCSGCQIGHSQNVPVKHPLLPHISPRFSSCPLYAQQFVVHDCHSAGYGSARHYTLYRLVGTLTAEAGNRNVFKNCSVGRHGVQIRGFRLWWACITGIAPAFGRSAINKIILGGLSNS